MIVYKLLNISFLPLFCSPIYLFLDFSLFAQDFIIFFHILFFTLHSSLRGSLSSNAPLSNPCTLAPHCSVVLVRPLHIDPKVMRRPQHKLRLAQELASNEDQIRLGLAAM